MVLTRSQSKKQIMNGNYSDVEKYIRDIIN